MISIVPQDKSVAKYLLVQYMRDARRMESKNIGVIVWTPGAAECRFVSSDKAGEVVNDTKNFDRWVAFWKSRVGKVTLEHHGDIADINSSEYYGLLMRTQNGNFAIVEAGESLDPVTPSEVPSFADFMFGELVDSPDSIEKTEDRAITLKQRCTEVFEAAGIRSDPRLQRDSEVDLSVGRKSIQFRYDYAWGDGRYDALIQRVLLKDQKSVLSTLALHEHVKKSKVNKNCKTVSVVNSAEYEPEDAKQRIGILSSVGPVVDVCDVSIAASEVIKILGV